MYTKASYCKEPPHIPGRDAGPGEVHSNCNLSEGKIHGCIRDILIDPLFSHMSLIWFEFIEVVA